VAPTHAFCLGVRDDGSNWQSLVQVISTPAVSLFKDFFLMCASVVLPLSLVTRIVLSTGREDVSP